MRALVWTCWTVLGAAPAHAADVVIGVAVAGNLSVGGLQPTEPLPNTEVRQRAYGPLHGGGGLGAAVPVRVAVSPVTALRIVPQFAYLQSYTTLTGLTLGAGAAEGCEVVTARMPSATSAGWLALGPEITLAGSDRAALYLHGQAGAGAGWHRIQTGWAGTDEDPGVALDVNADVDGARAGCFASQRLGGLAPLTSAGAGIGVRAGDARVELAYQRVAILANGLGGGVGAAEGLGVVVASVGWVFGG